MIFIDGKPHHKVGSAELIDELERTVREAAKRRQCAQQSEAEALIAKA